MVLAAALVASLFAALRWTTSRGTRRVGFSGSAFRNAAAVCVPLAIVGFATGYLTGFSRQPAVTATIPAILTLIGGLFAYVAVAHKDGRGPVGLGIVVFAFVLILSTNYYSTVRERERGARLLLLTEQERIIRTWRANTGMPEEFPGWILAGEAPR